MKRKKIWDLKKKFFKNLSLYKQIHRKHDVCIFMYIFIPSRIESRGGISFSQNVSVLGWMLLLSVWRRERDGAPWPLSLNGNAAFTWNTSGRAKAQTHEDKQIPDRNIINCNLILTYSSKIIERSHFIPYVKASMVIDCDW